MLSVVHLSLYTLLLKRLSSLYPFTKKALPENSGKTHKNPNTTCAVFTKIFATLPISQYRLLKIYFTVRIVSLYTKNVNLFWCIFGNIVLIFIYIDKTVQMCTYTSVSIVLRNGRFCIKNDIEKFKKLCNK